MMARALVNPRMGNWRTDLLVRLNRSKSRDDLFEVVSHAIRELGFEYCCYGAGLPQPEQLPKASIYQNYPKGWIEHYAREQFIEIDPTVANGQRSNQLQIWGDPLFNSSKTLWHDAQDHGLRVGVAQSAWAAGGVYGLLSLGRPSDALTDLEIEATVYQIAWVSQALHIAMVENGRIVPSSRPNLTRREYEILCWLAQGHTAESIGEKLSISTRTTKFHIGNILRKLGAANKVQAIVTGISTGLIAI